MDNKKENIPAEKVKSFEKPTEYASSQTPVDDTKKKQGDISATDENADEKVIVNEQREHKTVNIPSQTSVNSSEGISNDEETIDKS